MRKMFAITIFSLVFSLNTNANTFRDLSGVTIPHPNEMLKTLGNPSKLKVPKSFHIIVWNIFKGALPGWEDDLNRLTRRSEFVFIQEALLDQTQYEYYRETRSSYQWNMAQSFFKGAERISSGVITGHLSKSIETKAFRTTDREPILGTPKTMMFNKFNIEGSNKKLCVVNIHAINFVSPAIFRNQILQVEKILKKCKGPIIYAGDFNTWMQEKLDILNRSAKRLGLSAVTFENDTRTRLNPWAPPFDHIYTRGIKIKSSIVYDWIISSDHKPLSIYLEIN